MSNSIGRRTQERLTADANFLTEPAKRDLDERVVQTNRRRVSDSLMRNREVRGLVAALSNMAPEDTIDEPRLARDAGLPMPLAEACGEDAFRRIFEAIMQQTDDPTLPFDVGANVPFGTYEVIDYLGGACATMGVGLDKLSRYFGLITTWFQWRCEPAKEPPVVWLSTQHQENERFMMEQYTLGVTFGRFRSFLERPIGFLEVSLSMPEPPSRARHERFFGCPISYGAQEARCVIARESWDAPLTSREPGLREVLERHAADLLARSSAKTDDLTPVRVAIHRLLPEGPLKLDVVAKAVATSSRTLQRRLREAGTTFQALVDHERQAAARDYLGNNNLAVTEIAFLLGFSEASAFTRAFKRWTGKTPIQFRALAS
jgi:AraC-like DNA-binding protein